MNNKNEPINYKKFKIMELLDRRWGFYKKKNPEEIRDILIEKLGEQISHDELREALVEYMCSRKQKDDEGR